MALVFVFVKAFSPWKVYLHLNILAGQILFCRLSQSIFGRVNSAALEFVGICVLGLLLGLGAVAGAGGGTINVPVCLFLFQFTVKEATAFSNAAACVLSFIKFIYGRKKRDPKKENKTLIGKFYTPSNCKNYRFQKCFNEVFDDRWKHLDRKYFPESTK